MDLNKLLNLCMPHRANNDVPYHLELVKCHMESINPFVSAASARHKPHKKKLRIYQPFNKFPPNNYQIFINLNKICLKKGW